MPTDSDRESRIANAFVSQISNPGASGPGSATPTDLAQFMRFLDRKVLSENAIVSGVPLLHFMAGHARDDLVKELIRRGAVVNKTQQGLTPLHFAVSRDHSQCGPGGQERRVAIIRTLVKEGSCPVNVQELRGWTALKFAVRFRLDLCVQELLSLGADADLQDQEGFAPLHNAIGSLGILKALLPRVDNFDALNNRKQTALIIALVNRDVEAAEALLSCHPNTNTVDVDGNTPLILATRIGNLKCTQLLVKQGADLNSAPMGRTALHFALESNFNDVANWLVRRGASIFTKDYQGRTPIDICSPGLLDELMEGGAASAVAEGRCADIQRLVELGLDINKTTGVSGAPLLHRAAYCGHAELVQYLLENGASPSLVDKEGDSALHYVCLKELSNRNHTMCLKLLLAHAENPSLQNAKGDTPLHLAARQAFNHRVHILLESGADRTVVNKRGELALHRAATNADAHVTVCMLLDAVDKSVVNQPSTEGWTPLMYAARAGAIDIALFLVENGANVNVKQLGGFTALHMAVLCVNKAVQLELCVFLLKNGAVPNAPTNEERKTPLHIACMNNMQDVCTLLVEHGGDINEKDKSGATCLELMPPGSEKFLDSLQDAFSSCKTPVYRSQTSQSSISDSEAAAAASAETPCNGDSSVANSLYLPSASIDPRAVPRRQHSRPPVPKPRRRKQVSSDGSSGSLNLAQDETPTPTSPMSPANTASDKAAEAAAEAREAAEAAEVEPPDTSATEDEGIPPRPAGLLYRAGSAGGSFSRDGDVKHGLDESLYLTSDQLASDVPNVETSEDAARASLPATLEEEEVEMLCLKSSDLPKESHLGSGAYSDVYASTYHGEKVAVKLFKNLSLDEVLDVFDKEVRLLSRLEHPNVLRFIGYSTEPGFYAIVTDLLERGSLYDILHTRSIELPWTRRLAMMVDAAHGMEYLHSRKMLHRDLKSMNLLVNADWVVKVADFGLTKVRMHTQTMASSLKGTPAYMAPELLDSKPISEATDVYAFGIILYEVATRLRPYHEHTLNAIQLMMFVLRGARPSLEPSDDIPEGLVDLAKRCWNADYRERPPFTEICEWLQALNACVEQ